MGAGAIDRLKRGYKITTSSGVYNNNKSYIDTHYIRQFREVYAFLRGIPPRLIFNIDETQIHTVATRQYTKSINGTPGRVRGKPNKEGRVVVFLCGVGASGRKLDIVTKYRGEAKRAGNKFIKHEHDLHLIPSGGKGTPWINHGDILNYIHQYIIPITNNEPSLLLVVQANHHNNLIENHYMIMHNIKVLYVPARCTGQTQPLDVGVFGNFQYIFHQKFSQIYVHIIALHLLVCCMFECLSGGRK